MDGGQRAWVQRSLAFSTLGVRAQAELLQRGAESRKGRPLRPRAVRNVWQPIGLRLTLFIKHDETSSLIRAHL